MEAVGPQAVDGHFIAAVESDALCLKVESRFAGGGSHRVHCRFWLRQSQSVDPFLYGAAAGSTSEAASGDPIGNPAVVA